MNLNPIARFIKLWDGTTTAQVDEVAGALATIDYAHHEIHEGNSFVSDLTSAWLASAATLVLAFKTPLITECVAHMLIGFGSKGEGSLLIVETPTWDNQSGTLNPIFNRNRNSANVSSMLEDQSSAAFLATGNVIKDPTTLAGGTTIHDYNTWSDKKTTTLARADDEIMLKADTQYAIVYTSGEAANFGQIILDWYEH